MLFRVLFRCFPLPPLNPGKHCKVASEKWKNHTESKSENILFHGFFYLILDKKLVKNNLKCLLHLFFLNCEENSSVTELYLTSDL